jgi:hypothetical protein
MISPARIAKLKCPSCSELQKVGPMLRTMKGDDDWIDSGPCDACGVLLRVRPGRGLVYMAFVLIMLLTVAGMTGLDQLDFESVPLDFRSWTFWDASLRLAGYVFFIVFIAIPLAARVLILEQIK